MRAMAAMAVVAALAAPAAAQQSPLAPTEAWPSEVFDDAGDGIADDSQNDRAVLATTAQIQPRRSITAQYDYVHIRSIFGDDMVTGWVGVVGVKVGVTERLQLSLQSSLPRDTSLTAPGFKYQLVRRDRFQLAGYGSLLYFDYTDPLIAYGVVASRCLDQTCGALASANLSHRFAKLDPGELALNASLLLPLMDSLKLVGEVELANIALGDRTAQDLTSTASYGVRLHRWGAALTLSFVKPLESLGSSPSMVWATGSFRY